MRLNNKGFAITGILYTLFILFLLILVSVLSGLSSKRRFAAYSLNKLEDSYTGVLQESSVITDANSSKIAPVTGKYIFKTDPDNKTCVAYFKKGASLDSETITYIPKDCNDYEFTFEVTEIYSFEEE